MLLATSLSFVVLFAQRCFPTARHRSAPLSLLDRAECSRLAESAAVARK
jgi:hypothetical protein